MQSQPPPKGSLEELFRHHLLESEAAAVPPRPLVWEHIDNGLLQAQNEKYRRRLLAYRWGMAASLLLATLAGGGWWHSQQVATATLASTNAQSEAARQAVAGAVPAGPRTYASSPNAPTSAAAWHSASPSEARVATGRTVVASSATPLKAGYQPAAEAAADQPLLASRAKGQPAASPVAYAAASAPKRQGHGASQATGSTSPARFSTAHSSTVYAIEATATPSSATYTGSLAGAPQLAASAAAPLVGTALGDNASAADSATNHLGEDALATRLASLAMPPAAGLPAELAMQDVSAPAPTLLRRWRYGAEYAIGAFQPNIDFNRSTSDYNTALGTNTVSLTRAATAEYRANLRPGLSQRLGLRATRWLGGHWSLSTGLEIAQQEAYSATSSAFTGEQLADFNSFAATPSTGPASNSVIYSPRILRESSFRYRSAGVPIELQYDNQAKSGLSFYGRLGAIVSALLSAHSEVAGNSEATRTYSLTSASTPYRRLTALLRGSAGVRYRPAGRTWGLNVGPTAEAGVQSMNAETDRSFWQQSRPYSVGIEAGIEFGGFKPVQ